MMKKITSMVIPVLCAIAVMTGCSSSSLYNEGTYTASAEGYDGSVAVEVKFDKKSIVAVNITEQNETVNVGSKAVEELPAKIVKAQNYEVDAITGATVTSNAIKTAVKDCMEQAKKK